MANPKQHIVLLDPSIKDTKGSLSDNLGDVIIFESIIDIINKIFPDKEVIRISTHIEFGSKQKKIINNAFFCFAGGSNMLSSDIRNFPKMTTHKKKGFYFFPGIKNIILLGVGWNNYQSNPDWASRFYYNNILHKDFFHS